MPKTKDEHSQVAEKIFQGGGGKKNRPKKGHTGPPMIDCPTCGERVTARRTFQFLGVRLCEKHVCDVCERVLFDKSGTLLVTLLGTMVEDEPVRFEICANQHREESFKYIERTDRYRVVEAATGLILTLDPRKKIKKGTGVVHAE